MFNVVRILALAASALAVTVTYDSTYDMGSQSLATVACSDGANGLLTKGFTTFDSLPNFPNIGAVPAITGWNSTACGSCWAITFKNQTVNILGIDAAKNYNISEAALNKLTNGTAVQLGFIDAVVTQVNVSVCL